MPNFFDVIGFYIWYVPHIAWILPFRISAKFSFAFSLVMSLAGILLRNAHCIEVEIITASLRKPQNSFVPSAETSCAVKPMPKTPYNAVAKDHLAVGSHDVEYWIVEGRAPIVLDVIPDLPANAAALLCDSHDLRQYAYMFCDEIINGIGTFVFFAHAVRRRGDCERHGTIRHRAQKFHAVSIEHNRWSFILPCANGMASRIVDPDLRHASEHTGDRSKDPQKSWIIPEISGHALISPCAYEDQNGTVSASDLPVSSLYVSRLPPIWRTARSNLSESFSGLSLVARLL